MSIKTHESIKIYHIVHISRLPSIVSDGFLYSDAEIYMRRTDGVSIGMSTIKRRRRQELTLPSYPDLYVGECVPFYFCPRSVMLYLLYMGNHIDVDYHGGQEPVVHLVADLQKTTEWANANHLRWAFTNANAGARYFEDYTDLCDIGKLDWRAIHATQWNDRDIKEKKQAEFLLEYRFCWDLVEEIGVCSYQQCNHIEKMFGAGFHELPLVRVQRSWYY